MEKNNNTQDFKIYLISEGIEKKENITIIQSAIIGSRGWGYDDEDSDIDLRFFYVRPLNEYININRKNDTITYPINDGNDIQGFDLGRALKFICSQNPIIYEIINSPYQCLDNYYVNLIKKFSDEVFVPEQMIKKYYFIIKDEIKKIGTNSSNNVKSYIFILRMIATINYIRKYRKYPTCSIEFLFENDANEHLKKIVYKLIYLKKNGKKTIPYSEDYIKLFNNELSKIDIDSYKDNTIDYSEFEAKANGLLYEIILSLDKENVINQINSVPKDNGGEMII